MSNGSWDAMALNTLLDIFLAGDFNRRDQLWGGDDVSPLRRGEGDLITNLMDEYVLVQPPHTRHGDMAIRQRHRGDKVRPLTRHDGSVMEDDAEQAQELLAAFFPPLPGNIENEGQRLQRAPVHLPDLMMEEVEQKVLSAKSSKVPGEDSLPAMV